MTGNSGWTAANMPDLRGKTVVVTGANSGLGYEAAKAFAYKGAHVVMACRSVDRAEAARDDIREGSPIGTLDVRALDLADLDSIRRFAEDFHDDYDDLHVLCNNAGVMAVPRGETTDGFERQFGTNHLGHFALTGRLINLLTETEGQTRVVTQSSAVHERGEIDFDDLQSEREYDKWDAYGQAKLANVLFGYELQRRLDAAGINGVLSVVCHPGYAATNLQRRGPEAEGSTLRLWVMQAANAVVAQSAAQGAWPLLYAATAPDVLGGEYIGPGGLMNMRGSPSKQRSSDRSYDEETAERLWEVSEDLTGVRYDLDRSIVVD